jgi:hypothetical protein
MAAEMQALIAALRSARESWVDLGDGKAVRIRRPAEAEFASLVRTEAGQRQLRIELAEVRRYVTGWRGFSEADLLGPTVGNRDDLAFDADLWAEVVADRTDWLATVAQALLKAITDHAERAQAAAGNSPPTSTPAPAPTVGQR